MDEPIRRQLKIRYGLTLSIERKYFLKKRIIELQKEKIRNPEGQLIQKKTASGRDTLDY